MRCRPSEEIIENDRRCRPSLLEEQINSFCRQKIMFECVFYPLTFVKATAATWVVFARVVATEKAAVEGSPVKVAKIASDCAATTKKDSCGADGRKYENGSRASKKLSDAGLNFLRNHVEFHST